MRPGEVLETVPGVIITQHSGEGKANQYFLRGFNLDHGSDFATTIAGTPVNMPTHAHSQGYSDINFLIPELVAGVQFSKGPYFAEQGDFATAGAVEHQLCDDARSADRARRDRAPTVSAGCCLPRRPGGRQRPSAGRLRDVHQCRTLGRPRLVPEIQRRPPLQPRRRRQRAVADVDGLSRQVERHRGVARSARSTEGSSIASASIDPTDGGHTYRYSVGGEWQRGGGNTLTKIQAFGLGYDLNLISNFTFFLDDPVHGDQQEQVDHRFVTGVRAFAAAADALGGPCGAEHVRRPVPQRRLSKVGAVSHRGAPAARDAERRVGAGDERGRLRAERNRVGALAAHDRRSARSTDRATGVDERSIARNSGTATAGIVSPKGGVDVRAVEGHRALRECRHGLPQQQRAGHDHHPRRQRQSGRSGDAARRREGRRGRRPHCRRAASAEHGLAVDAAARIGARLQRRRRRDRAGTGEQAVRHRVRQLLQPEAVARVRRRPVAVAGAVRRVQPAAGPYVPEAVGTVVSGGASIDGLHRTFGSMRLRYFGPRALVEDNSVRSEATSSSTCRPGISSCKAPSRERAESSTCSTRRSATSTTTSRRGCRASRSPASMTSTSIPQCRGRFASA